MVFANKIFSNRKYFFRICKLQLYFFQKNTYRSSSLPVGKYFLRIPSPRIPRQVGRVQISRSCDFLKRDILPRGIFMPLYFPQKTCIYKFVNLKKNTSGWKIFFLRIPSPRILRQVGQGQMSRSWYFFKARYPAARHKCKSTEED